MADFATLADVQALTGKTYTIDDQARIEALLPIVSDMFRNEAEKAGKDIDAMIAESGPYANVVKAVTVDVVARVMRQSQDGDPVTQFSQSAMGYTVSGTYAIPGGGIANAIMRNDLKRLGLRRQKMGVIELWQAGSAE